LQGGHIGPPLQNLTQATSLFSRQVGGEAGRRGPG